MRTLANALESGDEMPRQGTRGRHNFNFVFGLLICLGANTSIAATLFNSDTYWPGLSNDDIDRMHAAAARLYEDRSIGTVERWRSPDSKDAGEVKLIRSFTANSMTCRTLDYTIRFDVQRHWPSRYVVNWCKIPNGEWRIVEIPTPR